MTTDHDEHDEDESKDDQPMEFHERRSGTDRRKVPDVDALAFDRRSGDERRKVQRRSGQDRRAYPSRRQHGRRRLIDSPR